jgi:hypothetical protein
MKASQRDGREKLLEQLEATCRLHARSGDPDTMIFTGGVMRDLEKHRKELETAKQAEQEPHAHAA